MCTLAVAHCEKNEGLGCVEISKVWKSRKNDWQKCFKSNIYNYMEI